MVTSSKGVNDWTSTGVLVLQVHWVLDFFFFRRVYNTPGKLRWLASWKINKITYFFSIGDTSSQEVQVDQTLPKKVGSGILFFMEHPKDQPLCLFGRLDFQGLHSWLEFSIAMLGCEVSHPNWPQIWPPPWCDVTGVGFALPRFWSQFPQCN